MSSDGEWNFYQYRAVLAFGLLFAGLGIYSWFDFVFLTIGREGTAVVSEVYKTPGRRGDYWHMEFKFKDAAGHERVGKYNLGGSSGGATVGLEIPIQYLPKWLLDAPDAARPKQAFNWFVLSAFGLISLGFGIFAYRAIYHSDERSMVVKRKRR
ncbi:MAG TPA: hypothetical protein VGI40_03185 [Pirellulaceae bacterium]|jgi:hypothetical protein